jgi:hypothetical protein
MTKRGRAKSVDPAQALRAAARETPAITGSVGLAAALEDWSEYLRVR